MNLHIAREGEPLTEDKLEVLEEYLEGTGQVCIDAGAGTGKTTTLIEVVGEAILRELDEQPDENPLDEMLITTFTKEAAGELKTDLKDRLREHERASGEVLPHDLWRWVETESHIGTIDSFVNELLREIAIEIGVAPAYDIADSLEREDLLDELMAEVEDTHPERWDRLIDAYPDAEWMRYPPDTVPEMIYEAHQKAREFCWTADEAAEKLLEAVDEIMYAGAGVPDSVEAIDEILGARVGPGASLQTADEDQAVDHILSSYEHSRALAEDFGFLLETFDELYNERTRREGLLSYVDVTYLVWQYLDTNPDSTWATSLGHRFTDVLVDEFQDTSYAQCQILNFLLEEATDETRFLAIGDIKQSIYEWRSAEPNLFASLIEFARANESDVEPENPPPLDAPRTVNRPLRSNFRSHPHLVYAANHLFESIFGDPGRGDVGTFSIDFTPLRPERPETDPEEAHIHLINTGDRQSADDWAAEEISRVVPAIAGLLGDGSGAVDREPLDEGEESLEDPMPGDVVMLFRRSRFMADYATALDEYGVDNAVVVTADLFGQPEVSILVDVLDWFANPHSKPSLIRILRSPISAVSDESLRYLASQNWYLSRALEEWPDELSDADRRRVQSLVDLRDDLRWDREGRKANLLEKIVRHSAFDAIVLGDSDPLQRYGNIWLLVEATNQWEEDELLSYREFVERLDRYREMAEDGDSGYEVARIADKEAEDTVTLMTIHGAKGLQFPIVVLPDLIARSDYPKARDQRLVKSRLHGMALHPREGSEGPPDNISVPGPGPDDRWLNERGTGPTWISDSRDGNSGAFRYPNPLNAHSRETQAEFWRLLYVAFTRAADHVVLPLGSEDPWRGKWTTWMAALRRGFDVDVMDEGPVMERVMEWTAPDGIERSEPIPVGINDLPSGEPDPAAPLDLDPAEDFVGITGDVETEVEPFVPRVVNPTTLHDLVECPLRFQYRQLQGVSSYRAESPPGSDPPGGMAPHVWGEIVHEGLDEYHRGSNDWARFLADRDKEVRLKLENEVIPQYESTETSTHLGDGADVILPEFDLDAQFEHDGVSLYIRGQIDLLYRMDGDWYVADFKTGAIAEEHTYLYDNYCSQLTTYAWLLDQVYDIELADARLVYVHPEAVEEVVDYDLENFENRLSEIPEMLADLEAGNLAARPAPPPEEIEEGDSPPKDSRCGTCPYSRSVAGLCEFG